MSGPDNKNCTKASERSAQTVKKMSCILKERNEKECYEEERNEKERKDKERKKE